MYCMVAEYCSKSKQTNVLHSGIGFGDAKKANQSNILKLSEGIMAFSVLHLFRTGLGNQQSLVHASSDRSNEGNQAEHGLVLSGL